MLGKMDAQRETKKKVNIYIRPLGKMNVEMKTECRGQAFASKNLISRVQIHKRCRLKKHMAKSRQPRRQVFN